jgi:hypothetical protein
MKPRRTSSPGLTVRSFLLVIALTYLGNEWLRYTGLIKHSGNFAESVPPIPAVASLLVLVLVNPFLQRWMKRLALSQAEVLTTYCMTAIAISMSSVGMIRYFLPVLTAPSYFATPENEYALFNRYLPDWLVVSDPAAVADSYRGSSTGVVPWDAWLIPLGVWTVFFVLFFWTMLCIVVVVRREWIQHERLVFPVAHFGLAIAEPSDSRSLTAKFFRNRLMWIGFGAAFFYNAMNIAHAFYPSLPAPGTSLNLGVFLTERPWNAVRPFSFQYRPAVLGLAYLMPLDVNFSVWAIYLGTKFAAVLVSAGGANVPGFPWIYDQASGAYMALVVVYVWSARRHLGRVVRGVVSPSSEDDAGEPMPYRLAGLGFVGGVIGLCLWCSVAGMAIDVALMLMALLLGTALVYTKIRAEAGAPMIWLFPWAVNKNVLYNILGPRYFVRNGSYQTMSVLASMAFLGRGFFPQFMAYQMEAFKMSEERGVNKRRVAVGIMLALVIGLVAGYYMHLTAYYEYGANILEGGTREWGGTRGAALIRQEYNRMHGLIGSAGGPDIISAGATGFGFLFTVFLATLRRGMAQFPLHPMGYAMVTAYGDPLWGAFLVAWTVKVSVTRLGGIGLYRRLVPMFLGVTLGHFFTAGILWGALASLGAEVFRGYGVWFG